MEATKEAAERVSLKKLPSPEVIDDNHIQRQVFRWELDTSADNLDRYSYEVKSKAIGRSWIPRAFLAFIHRERN